MSSVHDATPQKILLILTARFGSVPPDLATALQALKDQRRMELLVWRACSCPNLESFRRQLPA